MSAGLAFFFLVCLIPILLLGVSLVGLRAVRARRRRARSSPSWPSSFPSTRSRSRASLLGIVETRTTSGVLGIVVLLFFSTPLLSASRLILHRLLVVRSDSGLLRNLARDGAMALVLSTLLFTVSTVTWLYHWFRALAVNALPVPPGFALGAPAAEPHALHGDVLPAPTGTSRAAAWASGPALAGAVLASVLWEIAKQLFRLYIQRSQPLQRDLRAR